jgi:hypothetical protein
MTKASPSEKVITQQSKKASRLFHEDIPKDNVEVNPVIYEVIDDTGV